jgi:rod shape-determining protein MreC
MTTLFANRAVRRRAVAFTVLIAISLVLMAMSSSPAVLEFQRAISFALRPVQGAVDGVAQGLSSVVAAVGEIDRLHTDNAALRQENERLTAENLRLQQLQKDNDHLTGLLQLQASFAYKTTAAEVIGRESLETRRTLAISKGSNDGIKEGDVVIAEGGALVGRVVEVAPTSATVVLITDRSSTVVGRTETSDATGEVVGQIGGALVMQNIDTTEQIQVGEQVVTAGIELAGGIRSPYPKGLLLGEITDIRRVASSVVQTAYLQPTANLEKLDAVLVVLDYRGGLPPLDDTPIDCSLTGPGGGLPGGERPCLEPSASPPPGSRPSASPLVP